MGVEQQKHITYVYITIQNYSVGGVFKTQLVKMLFEYFETSTMIKALRQTQTLCAGCSKAEPKKFAPPQTPFPGARDGQNLISWRWSLPLHTNPVWLGSMHAISSYRGNRPTHTHTDTHKNTDRQDRLQYTAPQLARSVMT